MTGNAEELVKAIEAIGWKVTMVKQHEWVTSSNSLEVLSGNTPKYATTLYVRIEAEREG